MGGLAAAALPPAGAGGLAAGAPLPPAPTGRGATPALPGRGGILLAGTPLLVGGADCPTLGALGVVMPGLFAAMPGVADAEGCGRCGLLPGDGVGDPGTRDI